MGQGTQSLAETMALVPEYFPASQEVQVEVLLVGAYVPSEQG